MTKEMDMMQLRKCQDGHTYQVLWGPESTLAQVGKKGGQEKNASEGRSELLLTLKDEAITASDEGREGDSGRKKSRSEVPEQESMMPSGKKKHFCWKCSMVTQYEMQGMDSGWGWTSSRGYSFKNVKE